jgi:nitrogenase iron protein NifH
MRVMAFYGKGGIGKSTTVSNLSVLFARDGKRVLQFGCDPKADSSYSLVPGRVTTVMDEWLDRGESELKLEHCLLKGRHGVDCIEVGGPTPGSGCGGRGITKAFELVGDPAVLRRRYDVILFDVLGDVVCGGFSAPMREGYAEEVYVVTSGEIRSLFAANNISHAVVKNAPNGVKMGGLIGNLRGIAGETERLEKFAGLINSSVVHTIPRDPAVADAESRRVPVIEFNETSPASEAFLELYDRIASMQPDQLHLPRPLLRSDFDRLLSDT